MLQRIIIAAMLLCVVNCFAGENEKYQISPITIEALRFARHSCACLTNPKDASNIVQYYQDMIQENMLPASELHNQRLRHCVWVIVSGMSFLQAKRVIPLKNPDRVAKLGLLYGFVGAGYLTYISYSKERYTKLFCGTFGPKSQLDDLTDIDHTILNNLSLFIPPQQHSSEELSNWREKHPYLSLYDYVWDLANRSSNQQKATSDDFRK